MLTHYPMRDFPSLWFDSRHFPFGRKLAIIPIAFTPFSLEFFPIESGYKTTIPTCTWLLLVYEFHNLLSIDGKQYESMRLHMVSSGFHMEMNKPSEESYSRHFDHLF